MTHSNRRKWGDRSSATSCSAVSHGWLFLLYPVWAYAAVSLDSEDYALAGLWVITLAVTSLRGGGYPRGPAAWLTLTAIGLLALVDLQLDRPVALYLPPIVIPLWMCAVFAGSLRAGQTPIILRFARSVRGDLGPRRERYVVRLTGVWALMFALLALEALLLAALAPTAWWSWATNVANYGVLAGLFLGEFAVRWWLFGPSGQTRALLTSMLRADWR